MWAIEGISRGFRGEVGAIADWKVRRDEKLLEKYGLKANDAILAEEKHMGLYEDLMQNYDAKLIAGGAAQNTARGAQVRTSFPACISLPQFETTLMHLPLSVHPPRRLHRLHWLHRQRQVRPDPRGHLRQSRRPHRVPLR